MRERCGNGARKDYAPTSGSRLSACRIPLWVDLGSSHGTRFYVWPSAGRHGRLSRAPAEP
jgi:hypothetical protein